VRADVLATLEAIDKRDTLQAAERLSEHPLPTLLTWASEDPIFPLRFANRLQSMVPGAQLEQIADSGAFVPEDQPTKLAALIQTFLQQNPSPTG
jgi:pimeloyl-ACP methyl ester carboxylesterase